MKHWEDRPEESWKRFEFNQPYGDGLKRLRESVLSDDRFDPAVLWQWGTMQAMAVIEILKACEKEFGALGQRVVGEAIRKVGYDVGRQIAEGNERPEGLSDAELVSFFATVVNRVAYASLEDPVIDSEDKVSFDIIWCPHQDEYSAFDCRVQRYFVQGMLDAARESGWLEEWQVRFTETIPAGAEKCHFELWRGTEEDWSSWEKYSAWLERKALEIAKEPIPPSPPGGEGRGEGE
ncbi:MAG: hypothetical protein V1748_02795 [Actinomycetota bacterium]